MVLLTKDTPTPRLLSTVRGKPWAGHQRSPSEDIEDSLAGGVDNPRKNQAAKRHNKNEDPISDDSAPEKGRRRSLSKVASSDDSDDDGRPDRGGIRSTSFVSSREPSGRRQANGKKTLKDDIGGRRRQSSNGAKRRKLDEESDPADRSAQSPDSSRRRSSSSKTGKPPTSSSEHMMDTHGFARTRVGTKTFGKNGKGTARRISGSQEKQRSSSSQNGLSGPQSKPKARAKTKSLPSTFKRIDPATEEEESQGEEDAGFRKSKVIPDSSPSRGSETKFKALNDGESDSSSATLRTKFKVQSPEPLGKSKTKKKRIKLKGEPAEAEVESQAPAFQAFDDDWDFDTPVKNRDRPDSPLSDLGSDTGDTRPEPEAVKETAVLVATLCPWCGEQVDEQLLADFAKGKRLNVRQQTRFCRKHRKQTAQETWTANSYPAIDWEELPGRIATYYDSLLGIINGTQPSYYRSRLADKIEAGQDRAMKKEENLNPGYYGPRGFNLMCDRLVDQFGDLLKQKATQDRVISGRGSAAFIQSVLVAELAMRLIKDDMGVPVEEAREIMEESKAIGEMIHEEA